MRTPAQRQRARRIRLRNRASANRTPLHSHLHELRSRAVVSATAIATFSGIGWLIQDELVALLLAPAGDQRFIYTAPGGGFSFLIQTAVLFGVAASIPILVYQALSFAAPATRGLHRGLIRRTTAISAVLAMSGVAFAYFIGLPSAMHFLSKQVDPAQVEALLSVSSYLSFVTTYLAGAAIIFQVPLVMAVTNRITPLRPSTLMRGQTWVVVIALVAAAIITPTPDIMNMLMIAVPIILAYQAGIVAVAWYNKASRRWLIDNLRRQDALRRAEYARIEYQPLITESDQATHYKPTIT